ncbi:MAG: DUF3253 domain-containing protein [Mobilicoccus sp.]|nr:DUF3253 domain-containing protein [Mobilicoccus sp.]
MSTPTPEELRAGILDLLGQRADGATICPSEVARALGDESWRDLMSPVRDAAAELVAAGEIEVTQRGEVIDLAEARGPIRLRRTSTR